MYNKILNFIKYNNAFTIVFVICFFSFGITFAASPAAREGIYSTEEKVVSVDNSQIISADVDNLNFGVKINSVTEDDAKYYTTYSYQTLAVEDGAWKNKEIEKTLTVSKEALDRGDLGLYVARELGENIDYEASYLKRVQKIEKEKGESPKVVAVTYSGLVGRFFNPRQKIIDGYSPVIPAAVKKSLEPAEHIPKIIPPAPQEDGNTTKPPPPPPDNPISDPEPKHEADPATPAEPDKKVDEEAVSKAVDDLIKNDTPPPPPPTSEPTPPPAPTPPPPEPAPAP